MHHSWVTPERKLADVACARVRIQNLVQPLALIAGRFHDFAPPEIKPDTIKARALVNSGRVEGDMAFHAFLHGAGKDLTIGNVSIAPADDRRNALDTEAEIRPGPLDFDAIGFL